MNKTEEAIKKLEEQLATLLEAELTYNSNRGTLVTELPDGAELEESEDIRYFREKLKKARTLADIKISDTLSPLVVDEHYEIGNVIEAEKEEDWQDIKEKKKRKD